VIESYVISINELYHIVEAGKMIPKLDFELILKEIIKLFYSEAVCSVTATPVCLVLC